MYSLDPKAVQILIDANWSSEGWKIPMSRPSDEDFKHAIDAGLMFDHDRSFNHDAWISKAIEAAKKVQLEEVAEAFVSSLDSRRLDVRGALSSYIITRNLYPHNFEKTTSGRCKICGLHSESSQKLNTANFTRFKFGFVTDDISYATFDLEQFILAPKAQITGDSTRLLFEMLNTLAAAPPNTSVPKFVSQLNFIKGNKAERTSMLELLGVCGILPTTQQSYLHQFVRYDERILPGLAYADTLYPAVWWRGGQGLDQQAIRSIFGKFL